METILAQYGFKPSSIPNQFNWYNRDKAILWNDGKTVTMLTYSPNVGRLLSSITIVGEEALAEHFEKNNWAKVC